ncbi:AMP-binding protein [Virgibacillus alimentarius]|uniref:Long-chain acyl-CoA synthetase n=1 Tax=Virgibacillus alimentarius TaxID=698769 RepID=A0ABS4SAE9_9BACI|nr:MULTISPECIES: AMP-binding protein [Virgibacillus]MBP2258491.1 long-chain acyl-CoA synthetase [Virgibacillus alimentarius]HLR69237.1 AMP-binding protein [Virgibacillus sp.]
MGIGKQIEQIAQEHPDKAALIFKNNFITYDAFYQSICHIQKHLLYIGDTKRPQKVAVLIGNEPAFLEVFFAVVTLGWTAIPFDPKWSEREAAQVMSKAEADIYLKSKQFTEYAPYMVDAAYDIEEIKATPIIGDSLPPWNVHTSEHFYLGFTSGSTGSPKGFIRNHTSWLESFKAGEEAFQYGRDDVIMAPGPLCHSLSLFGAIHALHMGATFHLTTTFSASSILSHLRKGCTSVLYAVPTMLQSLMQHLTKPIKRKITFLSSGAKLDSRLRHKLGNAFPESIIYEYYGASELSYVSFSSEELSSKYPGSVGKPFPGVQITVRNSNGEPVPNGNIGKIYIESDFLFDGYVHEPEETKKVLTDFGANIEDLGWMNDEGVLTIVGREKNMMISGGLNVFPEEIEKVMKEKDTVKEAIVIGIQDEYWGQKVIALIQWKGKAYPDSLHLHCKQRLASYKVPKAFYEIEAFPYTSTGKIARKEIEMKWRDLINEYTCNC